MKKHTGPIDRTMALQFAFSELSTTLKECIKTQDAIAKCGNLYEARNQVMPSVGLSLDELIDQVTQVTKHLKLTADLTNWLEQHVQELSSRVLSNKTPISRR